VSGNRGFARRDRIAEQIRRELAELIRTELRDPRCRMISLTEVQVSADYAHAKVFLQHAGPAPSNSTPFTPGCKTPGGFYPAKLGKTH